MVIDRGFNSIKTGGGNLPAVPQQYLMEDVMNQDIVTKKCSNPNCDQPMKQYDNNGRP